MINSTNVNSIRNIELDLNEIFYNKFGIDFNNMDVSFMDEHLLGNKVRLTSRDLLYLFRDIEHTFNIEIPMKFLADGKFSSFNNLCEIISDLRKI